MRLQERGSLYLLAAESGVAVSCAGNTPVDLGDPQCVWFIESGKVDLFLVERRDGVEASAPQHLLRACRGRLLPGAAPQAEDTTLGLIAKGLPGTVLRRLPVASLSAVPHEELAEQVDRWIVDVSGMLSRDVAQRPRPDELVEPGWTRASKQGTLSTRRAVVWVSGVPPGAGLFLSLLDPAEGGPDPVTAGDPVPLTSGSWLTLTEAVRVSARSSDTLAEEGLLLPSLAHFHALAFSVERLNRSLAVVDQANLERESAANRRVDEEGARQRLFNLYGLPETEGTVTRDPPLLEALRIVGRHEGINFKWPRTPERRDADVLLNDVLDASCIRGRRVRLSAEDRWWLGDSGAMLAYRADDGRPVALLPGGLGSYREFDPTERRSTRITAERASMYREECWLFYRSLPASAVGLQDLLRLISSGMTSDFVRFAMAGLLGGLIALLPALLLGFVVDDVIPTGDAGVLSVVTAALAAFGLIGALLHMLQGMAFMRLEGRGSSRVEAAFWDRLLRLPPSLLHRYQAGDLAIRGMTFQRLRDAVNGVVANAVLSIIFLLPAFLVMFLYDALLGGMAAVLGLLSVVVTVALGLRQVVPHGRVIRAVQRVAGGLFQLVNGISTLRVGAAEGSAFSVWARDYREQKQAELQVGSLEDHLRAFGAALPFLTGAVLLMAVTLSGRETLTAGGFLVVYTLIMLFQVAVAQLGSSFGAVAAGVPAFDQIKPFLDAVPDTSHEGESVANLDGDVLFDRISFRYADDGPLILDDVTIHARPGEFVAIAGESGAGKSTLFRLALGLDHPSSGSVYFDGRDLRRLNVKQLRKRIGAVPQDVRLHPQDLWDNIVTDHGRATAEDAWSAARTAGVDGEIAAMPMGMLTPVGSSSGGMSGGESQRIAIARALVNSPRVLLLDEATNWLDNDNQDKVMNNLAALTSTRLVIAHRLSTLRQADRIYVMQAGRVVQQGSFAELAETGGVFRDLIRRQME